MIIYQNFSRHFGKNAVFFLERCTSRTSPLHWHDAIEFVYVNEGALDFTVSGERFQAKAGDLVAINSDVVHSFFPTDENTNYYFLLADDSFFKMNGLYSQNTFFESKIHTDEAKRLFCEIVRETEKADEFSKISTLSVLMSLFIYMNRHHKISGGENHAPEQKKMAMIKIALEYIGEHYKEKLTVEMIAEACHFSKSYLSHAFKEITEMSVISYINLLRCHNARALILEGKSIAESAAKSGFCEISYFTKAFKKALGILPSKVRTEIFTLTS